MSAARPGERALAREREIEVAEAEADDAERSYVGFITRVIAFALDAAIIDIVAVLVGVVVALVFSVLPVGHDVKTAVVAAGGVAFLIWSIAYFVTFWTTTGQTPGNRVMRIRVVRADASRMKPRHALLRLVGLVISLPFFWGYLPILLDDRRRGFFDMLAGTVVVDADP
jgi:uncharacterized RDD family membrane protein YckC